MRLILLGAPGSGKGTHGNLLSQFYDIPNISTGDILREAVKKGTELGLQAKEYMDAGELVPDEVMIGIVKQRLEEKDCKKGFILDGFPRTALQAEVLDNHLSSKSQHIQHVITLAVDQKKIIKRLTSRRVCRSCGKDYNIITNPPPESMKCELCGGEVWQRPDDNEETISNRLQVYIEKTRPLIDYYNQKGKLKTFDGNTTIENVQRNIREFLLIDDNFKESS